MTRASAHVQLTDNYLTNTRLRLRFIRTPATRERVWLLQQKYAPADLSRTFVNEIHLSEYEYEVFSVFEGNEIRKNRYPFMHDGRTFEIDVFLGPLWGLILAKTRFATDEDLETFAMPAFAIKDVTNELALTSAKLVDATFVALIDKIAMFSERAK